MERNEERQMESGDSGQGRFYTNRVENKVNILTAIKTDRLKEDVPAGNELFLRGEKHLYCI